MKNMTLVQHFAELRRRIMWTAAVFVGALCLGWYVAPSVQSFLTAPLMHLWPDGRLLYSGLTDGLMIRLSLAATVGLLIVIPVALWHVWAFVSPGLKQGERRFILPVLIMSPTLFVLGAAFAFYMLFPFAFGFFLEMNQSATVPVVIMPAARDYLIFAIRMLKVFGVAFQLPLVMVMLNRFGVLPRAAVVHARRYAIVAIVVLAAVLTPPDIVSQILLAVPMWGLFEVSLMFMRRS